MNERKPRGHSGSLCSHTLEYESITCQPEENKRSHSPAEGRPRSKVAAGRPGNRVDGQAGAQRKVTRVTESRQGPSVLTQAGRDVCRHPAFGCQLHGTRTGTDRPGGAFRKQQLGGDVGSSQSRNRDIFISSDSSGTSNSKFRFHGARRARVPGRGPRTGGGQ